MVTSVFFSYSRFPLCEIKEKTNLHDLKILSTICNKTKIDAVFNVSVGLDLHGILVGIYHAKRSHFIALFLQLEFLAINSMISIVSKNVIKNTSTTVF